MQDFSGHRTNYNKGILNEKDCPADPFLLFEEWMNLAVSLNIPEPTAMNLSTANKNGDVSSRVVLLKSYNHDGFVFFTNYHSRKGEQISNNNKVSALFFWPSLEKQIRIEGLAHRTEEKLSDEYFASRPFESQLGAIISKQSNIAANRKEIDQTFEEYINLAKTGTLQRPANWGGYCIVPNYFEFWQGRPSRLHDRIIYKKKHDSWNRFRLYP